MLALKLDKGRVLGGGGGGDEDDIKSQQILS